MRFEINGAPSMDASALPPDEQWHPNLPVAGSLLRLPKRSSTQAPRAALSAFGPALGSKVVANRQLLEDVAKVSCSKASAVGAHDGSKKIC